MIAADHIQPVTQQRRAQGIAVGLILDRRVAFDQVAECWIVAVIEQQVVQADFSADVLLSERLVFEQLQLASGGQVQNVQAGAVTSGQFHRQRRGSVASFGIADQCVDIRRQVVAEAFAQTCCIGLDAWCVFAMRQQYRRHLGEQTFEGLRIIHQHIASGGAHEHFDPATSQGLSAATVSRLS